MAPEKLNQAIDNDCGDEMPWTTRQETSNGVKGRKSMYQIHPKTRNSSYGTVANEVRHDRNCSCKTCNMDPYRGAHKIFKQELPMSIIEERSGKHQRRGSSRS